MTGRLAYRAVPFLLTLEIAKPSIRDIRFYISDTHTSIIVTTIFGGSRMIVVMTVGLRGGNAREPTPKRQSYIMIDAKYATAFSNSETLQLGEGNAMLA